MNGPGKQALDILELAETQAREEEQSRELTEINELEVGLAAPPTEEERERDAFVDGLRSLADFIESTPDLPLPIGASDIYVFAENPEEFKRYGRMLGKAKKTESVDYVNLIKQFGPHKLELTGTHKNVCKRVVLGTETVIERTPLTYETKEIEKEIVKWECPTILGGEEDERDSSDEII